MIEDANETRTGWQTDEIDFADSVRGFHGPLLSVREVEEEERFFVEALGFRKTGMDGAYHRFEIGAGGAGKTLVLLHEPNRPSGSWGFGAGTAHHVALDVADDEALAKQKASFEELGYTDCSEIKDRNYFHSIYTRSPGGILVECAATAAGGFARDEAFNQLGTHLLLPPLVRGPARRDFGDAGSNSDSGVARPRCRAADHRFASNRSDVPAC